MPPETYVEVRMRRSILCGLAAAMLGGCWYNEHRHERWHDQDVWRREDGRWCSRRGDDWVLRADVDIH